MESFSKRLDALRKPRESKKDFARRLGISPVQLSRYYSGPPPGRKVLERICSRTGTRLDWLLNGAEEAEEPAFARRLGAKSGRSLTDNDRVELACSHIDELRKVDREGREAIKDLLRDAIDDPEHLERLAAFLDFLKYEQSNKKGN